MSDEKTAILTVDLVTNNTNGESVWLYTATKPNGEAFQLTLPGREDPKQHPEVFAAIKKWINE